jgi:hypothetical protein
MAKVEQKEHSQNSALLRSNASYECPWLRSRSSQDPSDVPPPTGRIPWARAIVLERGGHVMVGQERRVRHEVRTLLLGTHATNEEESGR